MAGPDPNRLLRQVLDGMAKEGNDLGNMDESLPALTAFVTEFAAPDFVCTMQGLPPDPPTRYPGVEGLARGWAEYGSAFETVRVELDEVRETDNHVAVLVNQIAVTRHGGVEISQPSAMVFAFDGDRVLRVEFHLDRGAALRSAGLNPQPR